ncbi:MAG: hypothetical protein V1770_06030, partial [bacterium]
HSPAAVSPACLSACDAQAGLSAQAGAGRRRGLRRSLARAAVPYGDCGGAEPLNLAEIFKFLYV